MTKQTIVHLLAGALLVASGGAELLAQRGPGKMEGPGVDEGLPMTVPKGEVARDHGKKPDWPSRSPHMTGFSNVNASKALANNAALSAIVTPLLPTGVTLAAASAGFHSTGEFIATLYASQNLNISFTALKALVTGKDAESLGLAIHSLDPNLSRSTVRGDVRTAQREAGSDIDTARIENEIANDPSLEAEAQALLPAGTNLDAAVAGFADMRQFLAAANAAADLNISFAALKADITGTHPESLSQAIRALDPGLTARAIKSDVRTADQQAAMDIGAARLENELATNTKLDAEALALLPAGTSLQAAAAGFDSTRQFLLALNLSHDLNIPFSQIQAGVTGSNAMSFDAALSAALPTLSQATIKSDIETARQQTAADMQTAFGASADMKESAMTVPATTKP